MNSSYNRIFVIIFVIVAELYIICTNQSHQEDIQYFDFFLLKAFYWEACFVMTLKIFIFSSPYASRKSVERVEALTYKKHQTLSHYTRFISRSQQKSMEADSFTGARSWQLNASWCIFGLSSSKLVYMISLIQCLLLCNDFFFFKRSRSFKRNSRLI